MIFHTSIKYVQCGIKLKKKKNPENINGSSVLEGSHTSCLDWEIEVKTTSTWIPVISWNRTASTIW